MTKFCIAIIILSIVSLGMLIYPNFSHNMPYKDTSVVLDISYEQVEYKMSTSQIRERIENLTGVNVYWYKENNLNGKVGKSNLFLRQVVMDNEARQNEYIADFCHELLHIKYFTTNERFVTYKTFVTLYESEFRQVAINMACEMQNGKVDKEYNCLAQICDYLAQ